MPTHAPIDGSVGGSGGGGGSFTPTDWVLDAFIDNPSAGPNDGAPVPIVSPIDPKREYVMGINPFIPVPVGAIALDTAVVGESVTSTEAGFGVLNNPAIVVLSDTINGSQSFGGPSDPIIKFDQQSSVVGTLLPLGATLATAVFVSGAGSFIGVAALSTSPSPTFEIQKFYLDSGSFDMGFFVISRQVRP